MTAAEPILAAAPLWARARASFARALAALGQPAAIAAIAVLTQAARQTIIRWLCPLENIVRKLLLAEAAELHRIERARLARMPRVEVVHWIAGLQARTNAPPAGARHTRKTRFDRNDPHTWPAPFSLALPRDRHAAAHGPRIRATWERDAPQALHVTPSRRAVNDEASGFRLARRFEALRRVLAHPFEHARRLAHLLARLKRRFPEIIRRFAIQPAGSGGYDRDDDRLSIDALCASSTADGAFSDSS